jgi:hypothetical protein
MPRIAFGIFIVLHGLVHLLYFGRSWRLFELRPGMIWPDDSWAFSKLLGNGTTRTLASAFCVVAALGLAAGGIGILFRRDWFHPVTVGAAVFASGIPVLFWDGKLKKLDDQGFIGLLINVTILILVLILRWPDLS